MPRLTATPLVLAFTILALAPNAHAQSPSCPEGSVETFSGTLAYNGVKQISIALQPCETVSFAITTSADPYWGAVMYFDVYNSASSPTSIYHEGWQTFASNTKYFPTTPPWFDTIRGTRGIEGLPGYAILQCGIWGDCTYSITMTRTPRPSYNTGGVSFDSAPSIAMNTTQYGSLHNLEPGQFYKIHLNANQSIYMSGQALGFQNISSVFSIDLYDAGQQHVQNMVGINPGGSVAFPSGNPNVYTNPGTSGADYYIKLWCQYQPIHDFNFTINSLAITGQTDLWWFNGESPSEYDLSITLTSSAGSPTQWEIVAGTDKVTMSVSNGTQTTLTSTGIAFSGSVGDILVRASAANETADFAVTSRKPNRLLPVSQSYVCDDSEPSYGYRSIVLYVMQDQLTNDLPRGVPVNEQWTTGPVSDYHNPETNWRFGTEVGQITEDAVFTDEIGGEWPGLPAIPLPTCDGNSEPIQHWGQSMQVGSVTIGSGVTVQTDTLQKLRGRALHTNVVSPPQ